VQVDQEWNEHPATTPATDPATPPNTPGHRNLPKLTLDQAGLTRRFGRDNRPNARTWRRTLTADGF
jgi:hypothetical protein